MSDPGSVETNAIEVNGVVKRFGGSSVLDRIDLAVPKGSVTAILGQSGSGKTTLLRIIAGFERVDAGTVRVNGRLVDDSRRTVNAQHRGIGYVPQDGALFPHLSAAANIGFGLARRDRDRVAELLDLVGLAGLGDRRPNELSGGQQQRVALARALAVRPAVVLLDEPFSSLDASLRVSVRADISRILAETGMTAIIVTHDLDEALSMADHVAVLADGRMLARATPRELYASPPSEAAASHLGDVNVLTSTFALGSATCFLGTLPLVMPVHEASGRIMLRAEQIVVHETRAENTIGARVEQYDFFGHDAVARLVVETDDPVIETDDAAPGTRRRPGTHRRIVARLDGDRTLVAGQRVWIGAKGRAFALPEARSGIPAKTLNDAGQVEVPGA